MTFNLSFLLPELFLSLMVVIAIFGVLYLKVEKKTIEGVVTPLIAESVSLFVVVVLVLVGILVILTPANFTALSGTFISSYTLKLVKLVILFVAIALISILCQNAKQEKRQIFEQLILVFTSVLALFVLISAEDLILFYIALELQSLLTYVLAASRRENTLSVEAGLKYFVLGSLASGIFLFGTALLYGLLGTTNFGLISVSIVEVVDIGVLLLAGFFIISAVLFKLAAAPFHAWAPDVYEGSHLSITAVFSTLAKLPFVVFLCRFLNEVVGMSVSFSGLVDLTVVFTFFGLTSLCVGVLGALYQTRIKRLIAYSGIANVGYILLALSVASDSGLVASVFYMVFYTLVVLNVFLVLFSTRINTGTLIETITELKGIVRTSPLVAASLALSFFSFAGVPPLAGFFTKALILKTLLDTGAIFTLLFVALFSVLSSVYYIRVVKVMYFDKSTAVNTVAPSFPVALLFSITAIVNLLAVFYVDVAFYSILGL